MVRRTGSNQKGTLAGAPVALLCDLLIFADLLLLI
jgi:hypothetical protein